MKKYVFLVLLYFGSLQGNPLLELLSQSIPIREDGKINIPQNIKHIKLDIGLSYSAPMSQQWLSNEDDLWVFGFEPDPTSVSTIQKGVIKQDPFHGEPLNPKYVGENFFLVPCALGLHSGELVDFHITKNDCGCSSLYRPKNFEIEKVIKVPVFRLSDFFDLMPWDTHPIVEYIKIDAQGSDLDIVKSAGSYLQERVIYITIEPEDYHYENTINSERAIDQYMEEIGFRRVYGFNTTDPTYFNPRFIDYIRKNKVKIFQNG